MKAVSEIRLDNLEQLVKEAGTAEALAERAGLSPVYISQIRSRTIDRKTGKARNLGSQAARKLEMGMGKGEGWMDMSHTTIVPAPEVAGVSAQLAKTVKMVRMVKGLSVQDLADQSGVAADLIVTIERGDPVPNGPIEAIAGVFHLTPPELASEPINGLDAARDMLSRADRRAHLPSAPLLAADEHGSSEPQPQYIGRYNATRTLPVVGVAQLGENGYYEQLEYPVGHGDGYIQHSSRDPEAYVLQVRGDSMKPAIRNGWYVVVEPNGVPTPGEYVVIQLADGRKMVKELLFRHQRNGDIEVMSVNGETRISLAGAQVDSIQPVVAVMPPSKVINP